MVKTSAGLTDSAYLNQTPEHETNEHLIPLHYRQLATIYISMNILNKGTSGLPGLFYSVAPVGQFLQYQENEIPADVR